MMLVIRNGTFSAHDQVFTLGVGKLLNDKFSIGVNINLLNSQYETYHAFAVATNIATTYYNPSNTVSLQHSCIKNIGRQLELIY